MDLYIALYNYLHRDMMLHIFTAIGVALLGVILMILYSKLRKTKAELGGTQRALDVSVSHAERQASEIRSWRALFGPFVSLYENSPETKDNHDHDSNTIAIDLDCVILKYVDPWNGVTHFGDPIEGAVEGIKKYKEMGMKIVIYTTRNNSMATHNGGHNALELTAMVQNELEKHGIPYDFIALFKPLARYYLDDRAVRFQTWRQAVDTVKNLEVARMIEKVAALDKIVGGE